MSSEKAVPPLHIPTNADALIEAFNEHRDALKRHLLRRLRCPETAEDLTQETWFRVANGATTAAVISNPRAYLFRVASNLAVDYQRRERRRLASLSEINALLDVADDRPDPARAAEGKSEMAALHRILQSLPERRRRILLMARLGGLTHAEIARQQGISTRTVENEIRRALEFALARLQGSRTRN